MTTQDSLNVLSDAKQGWDSGMGTWPQMTLRQRIIAIQNFITALEKSRDQIVTTLMYEIGKNYDDAAAEFDRTVAFIHETIKEIESSSDFDNAFEKISSSNVMIRRNAFGIVLSLGPYNYPLNETYATIIPALLMGNIVILKIPQVGGLAHLLTFEAFSKALPPNTVHFISGGGRKTLPPLMESGDIDGLAFIGGTSAADKLIKQHPTPHRLKLFLQLEAKNMAIVMKDMVEGEGKNKNNSKNDQYSMKNMLDEIITGALSYNGQRCTALKIIFVPRGYGKMVANELAKRVDALPMGMPWELHNNEQQEPTKKVYSKITPLPNDKRVSYMKELQTDALNRGAVLANSKNGGSILENYAAQYECDATSVSVDDDDTSSISSSTLMVPAVLYNIQPTMRIFHEEQFGPIVPVVEYDSVDEVLQYGLEGEYGQQVSIFTNEASSEAISILDAFAAVYGKININGQCGRSPDSVPFAARRSSGLGVMSIQDALREFSVPTVISYKHKGSAAMVEEDMKKESRFMKNL